jgi:decaprenyl-phosphate phosphoribosyltransferase
MAPRMSTPTRTPAPVAHPFDGDVEPAVTPRDAPAAAAAPERVPFTPVQAWIRAVRVRQWPKNLLVFAAPAAAGVLFHPGVLSRVVLAFVMFCLLASSVYLLNDVHDVADDRAHPRKRHRAVASGAISTRTATIAGVLAALAGLALSLVAGLGLFALACGYLALNVAYTGWLRSVAIADIAVIATAFVLRATAGGIAAHVSISRWFIVVVSFSALFVAIGRRLADFMDPASRRSRPVLEEYTAEFLRLALAIAAAVALGAYCVWAFESKHIDELRLRELTIVPFTLGMLRYGLLVTRGGGSAPEEILFEDRFMWVMGAAWVAMFAITLSS